MTNQTKVETSVVDTEVIETGSEFDLKKALNTKGFVEFLASHPDGNKIEMSDTKEVAKRFETFEIKDKVAKGLKELYGGQIKAELGITLDSNELGLVGKHIEDMAISNPEKLQDLYNQQTMFTELPKQVKSLEDEFTKLANVDVLSGQLTEFIKDKANLDLTANFRGVVGGSKFFLKTIRGGLKMVVGNKEESGQMDEVGKAHKELNAKFGKFKEKGVGKVTSDVEAGIAKIEATVAKITDLQKQKEAKLEWFAELRKKLLSETINIGGLNELIQQKVVESFNGLMSMKEAEKAKVVAKEFKDLPPKIELRPFLDKVQGKAKGADVTSKSLDMAQQLLDRYMNADRETDLGIDVFASGTSEREIQEHIDADFKEVILKEVDKAVQNSRLGENALTNLEKALKPIIERKKIGSKADKEALVVVADSINEVIKKLPDDNESKAKRLLLCHILSTISKP